MESLIYFQDSSNQENGHPSTCTACGSSAKRRSPSSSLSPHQPNPKPDKPFAAPLPPPPLHRYNSEPVPFFLNPTQVPDNPPSPARTGPSAKRGISRSVSAPESDLIAATDSIGESPNSKRLKRMKDRMREMSKWCDQVITEVDEDEEEDEDHPTHSEVFNNEAQKDDEIEGSKNEEEAVSVEKNGENLIIHMKCPCSKSYQFLLSRNNCYYKLM